MIKKIIISLIASIIVMTGCSTKSFVSQPKEKCESVNISVKPKNQKESLLFQRFYSYWCFRQRGLTHKAFQYELPYQRFTMLLKKYEILAGKGYGADKIKLVKVIYPDKKQNIAIIERIVEVEGEKIKKRDKWFYIKKQWYHKFYQSALPPETEEEAEYQ